jgi:hypothetical protein
MVSEFLSKKHIDYRWPQFSDFWFTGVTTIACLIIEMIFDKIFYQVFYLNCKEKVNEEVRVERAKKGVKNMYKFVYYSTALTLGWFTIKDSYILPPSLGGSGSFFN